MHELFVKKSAVACRGRLWRAYLGQLGRYDYLGGPAGEVSPPQGKWRLLAFLGFSESCRQHKLQLGGLESIVALGQPACWF